MLLLFVGSALYSLGMGQGPEPLPRVERVGSQSRLIVGGKPMLLLGAEVGNSSASSLEYMEHIWPKLRTMHANAAYVPVSWELIEPEEGQFDFKLLDGLLDRAHKEKLRLVLLWFGAFKNTFGSYAPTWVRIDQKRFPRAEPTRGNVSGAFSVFSPNILKADLTAYTAMMRHLKQRDHNHTVVMVQVENEIGIVGSSRDHGELADRAFNQKIPSRLGNYLKDHALRLLPELRDPWIASGKRFTGKWLEVFGEAADETFMAWHYGRYVDSIAEAGRKELPLPAYVNAWIEGPPGSYPMGGPVSRMMDIWHAAAPSILCLAPDLYGDSATFASNLAKYSREENPVVVVESSPGQAKINVFSAVAGFGAMVFGAYPAESHADLAPLREIYSQLAEMTPLLVHAQRTPHLRSILVAENETLSSRMGSYDLNVTRISSKLKVSREPGYGLILQLGDGDYVLMGENYQVSFSRPDGKRFERGWVDEGQFHHGTWVRIRRLNGDEYEGALSLGDKELGYRERPVDLNVRRVQFQVARD